MATTIRSTSTYTPLGTSRSDLPNWLSPKKQNANIQQLLDTYEDIPDAFDPTDQVATLQNLAQHTVSTGGQAANSASREFATRSTLAGGTGAGAGVVRAQALMPFLKESSAIQASAADTAAKSRQAGLSLAASIANNIGNLRNDYTRTLASFISNRESLNASTRNFEMSHNLDQDKLQEERRRTDLTAEQNDLDARLKAAQIYAASPSQWHYTDPHTGKEVSGGIDTRRFAGTGFLEPIKQELRVRENPYLAGLFR